ncbi:hypothetical protein EV363DRAFT_1078005, partial [Boletus edulis]
EQPFESMRTELLRILEDTTTMILLAIHEDDIPLMGTFSWGTHVTLSESSEWIFGLEPGTVFPIQHVNDTTLERTYKHSAYDLCT